MSIAFINLCRSYFIDALNRLLEATMNFYGRAANVTMRFASPSLVNKDRLLKRVESELNDGLIDLFAEADEGYDAASALCHAVHLGDLYVIAHFQSGFTDNLMQIWVDRETGVNYLFRRDGNAAGLTVLLDKDGKVVVTPVEK